jgi:hypothetical protein
LARSSSGEELALNSNIAWLYVDATATVVAGDGFFQSGGAKATNGGARSSRTEDAPSFT